MAARRKSSRPRKAKAPPRSAARSGKRRLRSPGSVTVATRRASSVLDSGAVGAATADSHRIMRLVTVMQELSRARELPAIMAIVRHAARELTGADGATFVLRDGEFCYYADEEAIGPLWKGQRFPLESCISGWVMQHREPAVIEDIYADPRIPVAAYRPTFVQSLAMVPIRTLDPIGAIGNYWATHRRPSAEQLRLLQMLADATAVAIANVQASGALREERDFITTVLGTVGALVVVLDRDGRVVRCNRTCEQVTGYSAAELLRADLWEQLLLPEELPDVRRVFEALRAGEFPNRFENHWRHRDGSKRLISWDNTCLLDAAGQVRYIIATGIDVTDQRRSEDEARVRQAALAHAHRVMTAGELAAALAHELNQPLAAIASYSEAGLQQLRRGAPEPDKLTRNLEQIALQAQRAGHAIRELRAFLAKGETRRTSVDLNALAGTACGLAAAEARARGVRLELDAAERLPPVLASEIHIEHVLVNLLQNAIEAIHHAGIAGGTVRLATRATADGQAQVTVRDNGPGIDPDAARRIFEPFHTTKPQGLGMGLAISRSVVEAHDGRIWVETGTEPGAAVHFTLPLAQ